LGVILYILAKTTIQTWVPFHLQNGDSRLLMGKWTIATTGVTIVTLISPLPRALFHVLLKVIVSHIGTYYGFKSMDVENIKPF
jgi:hypothetical protein